MEIPSDIKKINMVIGDCISGGSSDNVSFKIKQWQNGNQEVSEDATCETNKLGYFSKGDTLEWSKTNLGKCNQLQFNGDNSKLYFWILADSGDKFCVSSVEIKLDNEENTTFYKTIAEENKWYDDDTNNRRHTATKN